MARSVRTLPCSRYHLSRREPGGVVQLVQLYCRGVKIVLYFISRVTHMIWWWISVGKVKRVKAFTLTRMSFGNRTRNAESRTAARTCRTGNRRAGRFVETFFFLLHNCTRRIFYFTIFFFFIRDYIHYGRVRRSRAYSPRVRLYDRSRAADPLFRIIAQSAAVACDPSAHTACGTMRP